MEDEDCKQLLDYWLASSEQKVSPSLLASVLLFVNKSPNGLSDLLPILDQYWSDTTLSTPTTTTRTVSDVPDNRVKCVDLLAQVLTPSISVITALNMNDLFRFIGDKLADPSTVPRLLDILLQLVEHDLCNTQHCFALCNQLFTHIPGKKWNQVTRYKVFSVLGHLLQRYAPVINRSPSVNFIGGFISVMDGEKDPRNLLLVFDLVRFIIDKLDISRHVEDLFDVVFCYFPISFTPPPNDPLAVTSEELKASLRLCLASSPYFAFFATPLLIEKLLSSTGSAKKDTMDTIRLCAPAYGAHALLPHAEDLFGALVKEVYQSSDISMESIALETIHQVVATLATGISIVNIRDPVEKAIEALLHQAVENLKEPELKNARSASAILKAAASASDPACNLVVNAVFPLLYQQYSVTDPVTRQKAILSILIDILEASNNLYGSIDSTGRDRDLQTPLTAYKQQLLQIFVASLISEQQPFDSQLHYQSLLGIRLMVIMKRFLSEKEIDITVAQLTRQSLNNDKHIRTLVLSTLAVVSKQSPEALIRHTLPYLLEALNSSTEDSAKYQEILAAIKTLTVEPTLFCAVAEPLLSKLDTSCRKSDTSSLVFSQALADCIYHTLNQVQITPQVLHIGQTLLFPAIVNEAIKANAKDVLLCWQLNPSLLTTLALILAIIVRNLDAKHQEQVTLNAFELFVQDKGQLQVSSTTSPISALNTSYQLFGTCWPSNHNDTQDQCEKDLTLFFPAIIGNCRKEIRLPILSLELFLRNIIEYAVKVNCDTRRLSLAKTASVIVNKWIDDDLATFLKQCVLQQLIPLLNDPDELTKKKTLSVLIWVTKGLVVRGHPFGFELLNKIIDLCYTEDLGAEASAGFAVLLHQDDMILNRQSHATISILYRQRIFHHCIPKLISKHEYLYCLVALSHILISIPTQVPATEISKLMPSIITALRARKHDDLNIAMLEVARSVVPWSVFQSGGGNYDKTKPENERTVEYLEPLLHALLTLAIEHGKTKVRRNALECLTQFAGVARSTNKTSIVRPYANSVIKKLGLALDDKKRLVRREAVDCREQWYMLLVDKK